MEDFNDNERDYADELRRRQRDAKAEKAKSGAENLEDTAKKIKTDVKIIRIIGIVAALVFNPITLIIIIGLAVAVFVTMIIPF